MNHAEEYMAHACCSREYISALQISLLRDIIPHEARKERNQMGLITLKEYTLIHGGSLRYLRQKAKDGGFKTVKKIGRDWFIDEDEPLQDNRITTGKWVGYSRKRNSSKKDV